jgi:gliding motility associated protien GldN
MKLYTRTLALALVLFPAFAGLQAQVPSVLDGAYVKETNRTKRVIPYPSLREADVMYTKRVWRVIDLTQKMNHSFYFPIVPIADRKSLFNVMRDALEVEGTLIAYGGGPTGEDDEFRYPLTQSEVDSVLNPTVLVPQFDLISGEPIGAKPESTPIRTEDVKRYIIKEDWIFDRQRSERYVRIIGIAPQKESYDIEGESQGFETLFWLYYPECRYVFANAEVYNTYNDAQRRSFEDLFQKRYFASYIIKESNVYDRKIQSYMQGLDILAEGQRIQNDLFELEHDLWHY